uniref:Glycerophosphodiester phosphodiesterase domain containing 3a n=1 Tax=Myripristis murdjan TaxID=586833 RepID=A0A667Y9H8_9TELE
MSNLFYFILPALGGYTVTSLYLLKNPHILHKRKCTVFHSKHISHRGGCGERIESTMEAFTHAVEQGTGMLELDCHVTHDGHVVVSHDENLLRQTGHDVTLSSLDLKDLPLYKERLEVTFYAGRYSSGADRKFALLEDLFRKFPDVPVNIEIKENNCLLIQKNPSMPYNFTVRRGVLLLLLFYSGLLPFVPLGESFLQFYFPRIINSTKTTPTLVSRIVISNPWRGKKMTSFDIEAAFEVGATGVMTDYPTLLSNYLSCNRCQD